MLTHSTTQSRLNIHTESVYIYNLYIHIWFWVFCVVYIYIEKRFDIPNFVYTTHRIHHINIYRVRLNRVYVCDYG